MTEALLIVSALLSLANLAALVLFWRSSKGVEIRLIRAGALREDEGAKVILVPQEVGVGARIVEELKRESNQPENAAE